LVNGFSISFYDSDLGDYVFCGVIPYLNCVLIPIKQLKIINSSGYDLHIRVRLIPKQTEKIKMELMEDELMNTNEENSNIGEKARRSKERKLFQIIEKVYLWRKLFSGVIDPKHGKIKCTLDDAAARVKVSKKSLDDYLTQIK